MIDVKIGLARLKKIKKKNMALREAIDIYLKWLREITWIIIKKSNKESLFINVNFDENMLSLKDTFNLVIALELFFHYIPPSKEERGDDTLVEIYENLSKFIANANVNNVILDKFFPYHIKHPYLANLPAIIKDFGFGDKEQIRRYINDTKQLLYTTEQRANINRFTRNTDKVHRSLIHYIDRLYNHYAEVSIIKTSIRPLVDLELISVDGIGIYDPMQLMLNKQYQGIVSDYSNVKKIRTTFFRKLYDFSEFGKHFIGHFWKLNHCALLGYWYEIILFFDEPSIATDLIFSDNLLSLAANTSYYIEPFKLLDRFDLDELIAGMKLMDSYLKLKPLDARTGKTYSSDRTFGKAEFRPNSSRPSSVKKQPNWQPL